MHTPLNPSLVINGKGIFVFSIDMVSSTKSHNSKMWDSHNQL